MPGLAVVTVFLYFKYILKTETGGMVYLGLFSAFLGLWKPTDLVFAPMLLPERSMALGDASLAYFVFVRA